MSAHLIDNIDNIGGLHSGHAFGNKTLFFENDFNLFFLSINMAAMQTTNRVMGNVTCAPAHSFYKVLTTIPQNSSWLSPSLRFGQKVAGRCQQTTELQNDNKTELKTCLFFRPHSCICCGDLSRNP